MELCSMIIFGSGYTEPRQRPMQISIGYVYIVFVSISIVVSVLGSVNEPCHLWFTLADTECYMCEHFITMSDIGK